MTKHPEPAAELDETPAFPPDFVHLAWRRAALAEARRALSNLLPGPLGDDPERPRVLCEEVPFHARFVPDAVIEEVVEELRALERVAQRELESFVMVRVDRTDGVEPRRVRSKATTARSKKPKARRHDGHARPGTTTTRTPPKSARTKKSAPAADAPTPSGSAVSR